MAAKRNFKFSEEMLNAIDSRDDMEEDKREEQNTPEKNQTRRYGTKFIKNKKNWQRSVLA